MATSGSTSKAGGESRLRVSRLGLAPVKGTRHLRRDRLELDAAGPVGDRDFCLVDEERSRVLRTVENPRLIAVEAEVRSGRLSCRFPDGSEAVGWLPAAEHGGSRRPEAALRADYWGRLVSLQLLAGPWSSAFSAYLGAPVRLARTPIRGAVVYGASVTVLTTSTVASIGQRLVGGPVEDHEGLAARFRSTVVLSAHDLDPDVELSWVGRRLRLGSAVLEVHAPVPRCAVIDLDPVTGTKNRAVLRTVAGRSGREPMVGVDATVIQPGVVRSGDSAVLLDRSPDDHGDLSSGRVTSTRSIRHV